MRLCEKKSKERSVTQHTQKSTVSEKELLQLKKKKQNDIFIIFVVIKIFKSLDWIGQQHNAHLSGLYIRKFNCPYPDNVEKNEDYFLIFLNPKYFYNPHFYISPQVYL